MPIYEYRCKRCGAQFEVIQRMTGAPLRKCRDCAGPLEKLVSRSSFQLKGSGWYVTDYAGKSSTATAKDGETSKETPNKETPKEKTSEPAAKSPSKESGGKAKSGED